MHVKLFTNFHSQKKFLYLEKYNLLTKQTKYSCLILHRSKAEKTIRATHLSSQLIYVLHLQDWTCSERTMTEKRHKTHGEMLSKSSTGGTCTRRDWGIQGAEYVLWWHRKMLPTLWCSLWHGLIWSLVCKAPLCQEGPWVPSTSPWALVSLQGNTHRKAGKPLQCTQRRCLPIVWTQRLYNNLFQISNATIRMKK